MQAIATVAPADLPAGKNRPFRRNLARALLPLGLVVALAWISLFGYEFIQAVLLFAHWVA
jgi:hypothetical protein